MRLQAAIQGDLNALLKAEVRAAKQAVPTGVRTASDGFKTELRAQITGAGLDKWLASKQRGEVYPKGKPGIVRLYTEDCMMVLLCRSMESRRVAAAWMGLFDRGHLVPVGSRSLTRTGEEAFARMQSGVLTKVAS